MKKIIALACTLVMLVSMFTISANAAVDGCTVTLDFAGYTYNDAGTVTYALVDVYVTIPDTLAPYEVGENDDGDEIFSGRMLQSVGIDIPTPAGLKFNTSRTSAASYVQVNNDKTTDTVKVYAANTGAYSSYYAGSIDKVATIAYKIEATEAVELTVTNAVIGLVDVEEDGTVVPREYKFADFTCTGETVSPEKTSEPETVEGSKVTSEVSEVTIGDAVYTNVAIFTATLGTANGNYSEAGFIWVKDGNKTDNKYTVDASVISGGGEVTYTAAMFAIADGVKIEAIPYYVTAE